MTSQVSASIYKTGFLTQFRSVMFAFSPQVNIIAGLCVTIGLCRADLEGLDLALDMISLSNDQHGQLLTR